MQNVKFQICDYSFYRFVIEPELQFTPDGKYTPGPYAKFVGLPSSPLLTQNLQVNSNFKSNAYKSQANVCCYGVRCRKIGWSKWFVQCTIWIISK